MDDARTSDISAALAQELAKGDSASVVALIDTLLTHAHTAGASDIHIDPAPSGLQVRVRIDGLLQDSGILPSALHAQLLLRLKVLASLRTDEHRLPQDGRFRFELAPEQVLDVRLSLVPTYHGEHAVLRLLAPSSEAFTLEGLGFAPVHRALIERALSRPHGMILASGPTGSGKTTTLYTLVKMLNERTRSIVTIEDPIEYSIPGINQIQTESQAGLSFERGLRSILRQDPDVIMVGEIRDSETARLAVNTALTGHLVLSTVHTNDAPTALPRLRDMGIEPYLIASTVSLVIAQRLVRRLCDDCKQETKLTRNEHGAVLELLQDHPLPERLFSAPGCSACSGLGYRGRVGIYETLLVDDAVREALAGDLSTQSLYRIARGRGMAPLLADGLMKAGAGTTSLAEVLRTHHE